MEKEETEINLEFQDFGNSSAIFSQTDFPSNDQRSYFNTFGGLPEDDEQERKLLGDDGDDIESRRRSNYSFWTFEYYQQFFNVESKQVGDRILWSIIPKPGINYLQTYIRPNPDLYGPFWICTTLVMTTAIAGNISSYFQMPQTYKWRYDFHKVTLSTSFIFTYAWIIPFLLFGIFYWRGSRSNVTLLELLCLYGYSLSVFVPVSLLWIIPVQWLQWCLGFVASVLSGSVLVLAVRPAFSRDSKKIATSLSIVILVLHASLALGFMLYFFYPAATVKNPAIASNSTVSSNELGNVQEIPEASKVVKKVLREKPPEITEANDKSNTEKDKNDRRSVDDIHSNDQILEKEIDRPKAMSLLRGNSNKKHDNSAVVVPDRPSGTNLTRVNSHHTTPSKNNDKFNKDNEKAPTLPTSISLNEGNKVDSKSKI